MSGLLRSELLKQRTTRTTLQLPLWMVGLVLLVLGLHVLGFSAHQLSSRDHQLKICGWGTGIGCLFAALLGALSITAEIRHGTIRPTFLATPRRARVIAAKVAASALGGLVLGLLAESLVAAVTSTGLAARAASPSRSTPVTSRKMLAGGGAAAALWAAIGSGVGALVRNQIGTIIGLCKAGKTPIWTRGSIRSSARRPAGSWAAMMPGVARSDSQLPEADSATAPGANSRPRGCALPADEVTAARPSPRAAGRSVLLVSDMSAAESLPDCYPRPAANAVLITKKPRDLRGFLV